MATTPLTTIDEFARIDEPGRFDLIRGEIVRMRPAGFRHGVYASRIATALSVHVSSNDMGEVPTSDTGYVLSIDPPVVLCPDTSFVRAERLPEGDYPEGFLEHPPDIAVEVVSPSDRMADVNAKVDEYIRSGTALVWVVEPRRRTVTVYRPDLSVQLLVEDDVLDGGDVLPGFNLPVSSIFR
jgi:Uma2 family endonuclease